MKSEIFIMLTPKKIFFFTGDDPTEKRLKVAIEPYQVLLRRLCLVLDEIEKCKRDRNEQTKKSK